MNNEDEKCILEFCNTIIKEAGGSKRVRKIRKGHISNANTCPIARTIRAGLLGKGVTVSVTSSAVRVFRRFNDDATYSVPTTFALTTECIRTFVNQFDRGKLPKYDKNTNG